MGIRIYPQTILAETAVKDGIVSPDDNLLEPQFYLVPNLQDWIRGVVDEVDVLTPQLGKLGFTFSHFVV